MDAPVRAVLNELGAAIESIEEAQAQALCEAILQAGRIAVMACGRERLQLMGFAMRLFHLGLPVHVVGDMTTPPLAAGDLLIACSGPGETATVLTIMDVARASGAHVFLLTAEPQGSAAARADAVLVIPAQTMASDQGAAKPSVLPMGSLFEGALFVLFELLILRLAALKSETPKTMRARHTNLE